MASLSGNKIKDTYQSLIKLTDNGNLTTGAKQLTDGFGNNSPLYISTTQIGIGVTPEATYDLHVYQNAKVGGNLTITGDLTVNGTTTTVDTDTLRVEDPLIEVARNNTSSDAVDIGIYGKYAPSGTTLYAGLFRDTGDDKFKLFKSLEEQPTTTVNTSGTGYAKAGLVIGDLESTAGIFSGDVSIPQTNKIRFDGSSGHTYISEVADSNLKFFVAGIEQINITNNLIDINSSIAMNSNNISGGGTFTATTFSGQLDGTISSATTATTQTAGDNSTKVATTAYVDSIVTAQDLDFAGDSGTGAVDLDSQTFTIAGTSNEIETSASGQTLTIGLPDDVTVTGELTVSGTGQSSFGGQVTVPATPSASTDAASKGYVDSQVGANNELSEVLANGNTTGGTDIIVSTSDQIFLPDGSATNPAIAFSNDTDSGIYHSGTQFIIAHAGSNKMIIANSQVTLEDRLIVNDSINADDGILIEGASNPYLSIHDETNETYTALWSGDTEAALTFSHSLFRITSSTNNFTGTDLVTITSGGNVGIGTDSPAQPLSVHGNFLVRTTNADGNKNRMQCVVGGSSDAANLYLYYGNSGDGTVSVRLNAQGDSYLNGGNVGIGTTSPQSKLHISTSTTNAPIRLQNDNGSGSTANYVLQTDSSGLGNNGFGIYDVAQSAYRFVIDGSGDVGIGVTDPEKKLEVKSDTTYDGIMIDVLSNPEITLRDRGNSDTLIGTGRHGLDGFHIDTYSGNAFFIKGSNRYVGIGTTSPSYELDVSGEINATTRYRKNGYEIVGQNSTELRLANASYWQTLALYTNGTPRLTIDSSGKVGIGVTSPAAKLHVSGDTGGGDSIARFQNTNSTAKSTRLQLLDSAGTVGDALIAYDHSNASSALHYLGMGVNNSTTLVINNSDQVGIGTTTPNEKLVIGTTGGTQNIEISNSFIQSFNRSGSPGYASLGFYASSYAFNVGNVGIGTTSPDALLELEKSAVGAVGPTLLLNNSAGGGGDKANIIFASFGTTYQRAKIEFKVSSETNSPGNIDFYTGRSDLGTLTQKMTILGSGNVGIGTSTFASTTNLQLKLGNMGSGIVGEIFDAVDNADNSRIIICGGGTGTPQFSMRHYSAGYGIDMWLNTSSPWDTYIDNRNAASGFIFRNDCNNDGGENELMRITGSGNVIIGNTTVDNPNSLDKVLEIEHGGSVGLILNDSRDNPIGLENRGAVFHLTHNTNSRLVVDGASGQVGIGTTSPGAKLDIVGSSSGSITNLLRIQNPVNSAGTGHGASLILHSTSDSNRGVAIASSSATNYATNNNMLFYTSSSSTLYERMRIDSNGQVGIGTSSPGYKLDVDSTAAGDWITRIKNQSSTGYGLYVQSSNNAAQYLLGLHNGDAYQFIVNGAGSVGIGTTSPNQEGFGSGNRALSVKAPSSGGVANLELIGLGNADNDELGYVNFMSQSATNSAASIVGLRHTSDTSGKLVFRTANVERMRITENGDVGIGDLTPSSSLQAFGSASKGLSIANQQPTIALTDTDTGSRRAYLAYEGGSYQFYLSSPESNGIMTFQTGGFNERMRITSGGNVGIGTTSPNQQLDVSGNIAVRGGYKIYFNSEVNLNRYIGASSSNDLDIAADDDINYRSNFNRFFNGSTEFARLSGSGVSWLGGGSNGYVGIGTTSPTVPLAVHGQQKWYTTNADGNELRGFFNPGGAADGAELYLYRDDGATQGVALRGQGNSYFRVDSTSDKLINFYYGTSNVGQIVTGGTNVLYQSNSDYRLKENVVEMTGALDRVSQLKPSRYNFISHPGEQVDGFMAHELQEVVPQAVSGEKDEMNEDGTPKYQGVDHSQIVPLLVGAIKELKAEIETLKTQINK